MCSFGISSVQVFSAILHLFMAQYIHAKLKAGSIGNDFSHKKEEMYSYTRWTKKWPPYKNFRLAVYFSISFKLWRNAKYMHLKNN